MNKLLEDDTGLETARILTWPSKMSYADWWILPSVHVHGRFARFVDPELKQPKSRHFEEKNDTILQFHFFITYSLLGHLKGSFSKDKATPVKTARADLTISWTNGRAPEVAFSPFRAIVFSFEVALSLLNLAHWLSKAPFFLLCKFFCGQTRFELWF